MCMTQWAEWRGTRRDVERRVRRWKLRQLWKAPIFWIAGGLVWILDRMAAQPEMPYKHPEELGNPYGFRR